MSCRYCRRDDKPACRCIDPKEGYLCTRKRGHKGKHVACGIDTCNIKAWKRDTKEKYE